MHVAFSGFSTGERRGRYLRHAEGIAQFNEAAVLYKMYTVVLYKESRSIEKKSGGEGQSRVQVPKPKPKPQPESTHVASGFLIVDLVRANFYSKSHASP